MIGRFPAVIKKILLKDSVPVIYGLPKSELWENFLIRNKIEIPKFTENHPTKRHTASADI